MRHENNKTHLFSNFWKWFQIIAMIRRLDSFVLHSGARCRFSSGMCPTATWNSWTWEVANFGVCRRFCRFRAPHCRDKLPNLPNQAPAVYSDVTCLDFEVEWKSWNFCRWETLNMFWYVLTVFRASFKCSCIASPLVCPQTSAICQLSPDICIFETKQIELRQVRSAIFVEFVHCIECMCGCVIGSEKMLIRWITH